MHRDLTLKNILVSDDCDTFLADFGLARAHETASEDITLDVVTLEYRAPELLLQYKKYDARVDMWSIGCMVAELFLRRRLLVPLRRDVPCQLLKLVQVFGKPDMEFVRSHASPSATMFFENIIKKFDALEQSEDGAGKCFDPPITVQLAAAGASPQAIELILSLLQFDFRKRLSAACALKLSWFADDETYQGLEGVAGDGAGGSGGDPASPTVATPGVVERMDDGEIVESNESLHKLQRADLEGLRAFMEAKATPVVNRVRGEYNSAPVANTAL